MEKEKEKERQDREIQEVMEKINKVSKAERTLQRSLAGSKVNTPRSSPKITKRKQTKKSGKQKEEEERKERERQKGKEKKGQRSEPSKEERSEYTDVSDSLIKIKHGRNSDFASIVANAMDATDNLIALKQSREDESKVGNKKCNSRKEEKKKTKKEVTQGKDADSLFDLLDKIAGDNNKRERSEQVQSSNLAQSLLTALGECEGDKGPGGTKGSNRTIKMLSSLKKCLSTNNSDDEGNKEKECNKGEKGDKEDKVDQEGKNKKLVSGKNAKPEESDIKIAVKFAHEKLDSKHVKNKKFDHLEFNTLIAGELELALLPEITQEERMARIGMARTMCYHNLYLNDKDLRDGYEAILNKVEQGILKWSDDLSLELHNYLDYRANINLRSKVSGQEGFTKVEHKRKQTDKTGSDKVMYCLEYNLGSCPQSDHHEGRLGQRKVTKFHICRKCHRDGEFKSHKDTDEACPKKRS